MINEAAPRKSIASPAKMALQKPNKRCSKRRRSPVRPKPITTVYRRDAVPYEYVHYKGTRREKQAFFPLFLRIFPNIFKILLDVHNFSPPPLSVSSPSRRRQFKRYSENSKTSATQIRSKFKVFKAA